MAFGEGNTTTNYTRFLIMFKSENTSDASKYWETDLGDDTPIALRGIWKQSRATVKKRALDREKPGNMSWEKPRSIQSCNDEEKYEFSKIGKSKKKLLLFIYIHLQLKKNCKM